jgi:YegS/Rv2252/BmrU family lipid kinase
VAARVLLVVNPASRRGSSLLPVARRALEKAGAEFDVVLTERPGHAADFAGAMQSQYDSFFTLGGDGTAMEVIGALAYSGRPVGILAGGTGNQLARSLGIPLDVRRAVPALLGGKARTIDLGRINDERAFALALGIGPDVAMIAETSPAAKRRFGVLAYMAVGLRSILRLERYVARVSVDGHVHEQTVTAIMVANLPGVEDGRITFGPDISPVDGQLDVCLWNWPNAGAALETFWRSATGAIATDPNATFLRGRRIHIEALPARHGEADGELVGVSPFSVTCDPLAANILVPNSR